MAILDGMRIPTITIALFCLCACGVVSTPGPAVRLANGASDTIIVNKRGATPLPFRALDAGGRTVEGAPIRYEWAGGDSLPVDMAGTVTCTRSGDLVVRARLESFAARVYVHCRPVEYVRIPGPVQFILGDSELVRPRELPVEAYGPDGRPVSLFATWAQVRDSSVVAIDGLTLRPLTRGITLAGAIVGDRSAAIGVHVYQRVSTLSAIDTLLRVPPHLRLFAVPLRLESGEMRRQRLPPGNWMLAMLPEQYTNPSGLLLRVEGAACRTHLLNTPRRFGCNSARGADLIVYHPFSDGESSVATGDLLVRWMSQ
ncbi:MAG: hypothetical protein ABI877_11590 [Gemmatimonadaceae bacterium]